MLVDARNNNVPSIEIRDWPAHLAEPVGFTTVDPFRSHVLDLSGGEEAVWARMSKDMRYSIRRAGRNGVTVREATAARDFEVLYAMYRDLRKRQGLLPQPRAFVAELCAQFVSAGTGALVMAEHEGRPVAALLYLSCGQLAVGTHSASYEASRNLRAMPLAMWRAVQIACDRGVQTFDLGRTDSAARGLKDFKAAWERRRCLSGTSTFRSREG